MCGSFNAVYSQRECSGKPDAMPILKCWEKLEAMNVSSSAGTEEKSHEHRDQISEKGFVPDFSLRSSAQAHRYKRRDEHIKAAVDKHWHKLNTNSTS